MSFSDIWTAIREKFPPARAVAFLTPFVLPLLAYVNTWIADNAPWVEQYVGATEREGIFIGTVVAGVALAYKWLDGRAKWETSQVEATVELAKNGKGQRDIADGDLLLSLPSDIDDSDAYDEPDFEAEPNA